MGALEWKNKHNEYIRNQFTLFCVRVRVSVREYLTLHSGVLVKKSSYGHFCSIFLPYISIKFDFQMAHICSSLFFNSIKVSKLPDASSKRQQAKSNKMERKQPYFCGKYYIVYTWEEKKTRWWILYRWKNYGTSCTTVLYAQKQIIFWCT